MQLPSLHSPNTPTKSLSSRKLLAGLAAGVAVACVAVFCLTQTNANAAPAVPARRLAQEDSFSPWNVEDATLADAALYTDEEYQDLFAKWRAQYHKEYTPQEFSTRFENFKVNLNYITLNNQNAGAKSTDINLSLNKYADLSQTEFQRTFLGMLQAPSPFDVPVNDSFADVIVSSLPTSVDWRTQNAVSPVTNQGSCGSCWSFAAVQTVESVNAMTTGKMTVLSKQQVLDCAGSAYGNYGCQGGLPSNAFTYMVRQRGVATEASYPYQGVQASCRSFVPAATITGFQSIPAYNEDALQAAVAQQPVAVAIQASQRVFMFYSGGIINDNSCGTRYDHAVVVVGYGTENNVPYWIVKNSWGASWGENGYVRIKRNPGGRTAGMCGIALLANYPTVSAPLPTPKPDPTPTPKPTATPVPTATPTPVPTASPKPTTSPQPTNAPENNFCGTQQGIVCPKDCCPDFAICVADFEFPLQHTHAGTVCYKGQIIPSTDARCAAAQCA